MRNSCLHSSIHTFEQNRRMHRLNTRKKNTKSYFVRNFHSDRVQYQKENQIKPFSISKYQIFEDNNQINLSSSWKFVRFSLYSGSFSVVISLNHCSVDLFIIFMWKIQFDLLAPFIGKYFLVLFCFSACCEWFKSLLWQYFSNGLVRNWKWKPQLERLFVMRMVLNVLWKL